MLINLTFATCTVTELNTNYRNKKVLDTNTLTQDQVGCKIRFHLKHLTPKFHQFLIVVCQGRMQLYLVIEYDSKVFYFQLIPFKKTLDSYYYT